MSECCGTCEYFCEVRKYPTYQDIATHICVQFLVEDHADYILETTEHDVCECWKKREEVLHEAK